MKICNLETIILNAYRTNWSFVKVTCDDGTIGWGEASLGTRELAVKGCVEDLKRLIVGRNPLEIEKMIFEVTRDSYWKGGPVFGSALSAIEMACWDIMGKHFSVPVYTFLGGKMRDRVRMYANAWFVGAKTPEEFAAKAKLAVSKGITALKWDPFGKAHLTLTREEFWRASEIVGAVREAVGPNVDLLIECHGRFVQNTAIEVSKELAQYHPMFMEEPVEPNELDMLVEVHKKSAVPIAAGERIYQIYDWYKTLKAGAIDYAQPDVCHCGGILETKKIAAFAQAAGIMLSIHNPSGPLANAAILNLAATIPNFFIHEIMMTDVPFRGQLSNEEVCYENGCILIGDKPGLGVEINESAAAEHPYEPINLRHYNGNLTNIRPAGKNCYYFKGIASDPEE